MSKDVEDICMDLCIIAFSTIVLLAIFFIRLVMLGD